MMELEFDNIRTEKILKVWQELVDLIQSYGPDFEKEILKRKQKYDKEKTSLALEVLKKYPLTSKQGLSLMSLAECLPRIENETLRKNLVSQALINFNTLGAVADKALSFESAQNLFFDKTIKNVSESFVWSTSLKNMNIQPGTFISIDCLGEAAQTKEECKAYLSKYKEALELCQSQSEEDPFRAPLTVSVKTSAITTDFDIFNGIDPALKAFEILFKDFENSKNSISITLDAEEAHRSDLQRQLFTKLNEKFKKNPSIQLSIAQQAYLSNGLEELLALYEKNENNKKFGVRIVKGAYYDYEIRESQRYRYTCPVFKEKFQTDISWCLMSLVSGYSANFSHFATHNPQSIAFIELIAEMDERYENFSDRVRDIFEKNFKNVPESLFNANFLSGGAEFQYLHGMGKLRQKEAAKELSFISEEPIGYRAYAPVGGQKELLPYLVRRLLENGVNNGVWQSNSNYIFQEAKIETENWKQKILKFLSKKKIKLDCDVKTGFKRVKGDLWWKSNFNVIEEASKEPILKTLSVLEAQKLMTGHLSYKTGPQRIQALERLSKELESSKHTLISRLTSELNKHPLDALAEWQEANDFINFYIDCLKSEKVTLVKKLSYMHAEENTNYLVGMKNVLCISPWNFPLAISLGQIGAALAAGVGTIYLKPSPKLSKIYAELQAVLIRAGVDVLFVQDSLENFENFLIAQDCVLFTGGNESFKRIKEICLDHPVKLIGETAGVNCLVSDASAEPGFVAETLIKSSFYFSGQKCSSVRIAFIDKDIYDPVLEKLKKYEIKWGNSLNSLGRAPIDSESENVIEQYISNCSLAKTHRNGKGAILEQKVDELNWKECFGPVLQVVKCDIEKDFESILDLIRSKKYGLTFTLLSKDKFKIEAIAKKPLAGNQYVNRGSTGAVVDAQPFGGFGLSGTGPKIGSADLILALSYDCVTCLETSSMGGTSGLFEKKIVPKLIDIVEVLSKK